MSARALVRLAGVSRAFGGAAPVRAVREADLELERGALTLVMGPSGSGKTTLLSLIGGLLAPDGGTIDVAGVRVDALPPAALSAFRLRQVGFVFQRSRLLEALTARENIELPMRLAGLPRAASWARAGELAGRVGLASRLDAGSGALSGGEQQRVALARALVNDPPLLLADEPTGSLDRNSASQVIECLRAAAQGGAAVLVVSHDPRLERHADRTLRMEDGRLS